MFLTPEELAELTGIRGGCRGRTRNSRQADQLRVMGIPFFLNAQGRPIVARSALEGQHKAPAEPKGWKPKLAA